MFVSVCNSLYLSICLYLFICSWVVKAATVRNSQEQNANSLAVTAVTAACLYRSIRSYLCISVCIRPLSVLICIYLFISVHICAYLFISKNFIVMEKNQIFRKKVFGFKSVLKTGGPVRSSKIKNSHVCDRNRSQDLPVPCNSPNHLASTAVHIFHLIWYIFLKHVHICLYWCICNMNRYERDMCMYESVHICGGDINKSS